MKKKLAIFIICIVSSAILAAGCSNISNVNEPNDASTESDNKSALTFDNYGRKVTVTEKPTKVLTLGPNATELFVALELTNYVIGSSLNNHSRGPLPEFSEDFMKIPELTYGSATREAVITSGADFIYGIDWEFGGEGLDVEELAKMGITTYMNSASSLDEMFQEIRDIGKIFEIEETAEAFIADQETRIANVKQAISDEDEIKVLVYDSGGDGVFTAGGTNFETLLIEYAGGKNVFEDIVEQQWATVSYEEVLKRDPDVIVIHDYDSPSLEQKITDIKNNPALSKLKAVQEERFISISLESVLPGNRIAHAVETFAKGFYPERFD